MVSIHEDENVNAAFCRNNTPLTKTSQHAFKLGKGVGFLGGKEKKGQSLHIYYCISYIKETQAGMNG